MRHSCITRAFLPAAPIQHFAKLSPAGSAVQCIRGVCAGPPRAVVKFVETPADQFPHPEGRGFPDIHSLPEVPSLLQRPLWHLSFPVGSVFHIFHSLLARSAFFRPAPLPYWTAEPAGPSSRPPAWLHSSPSACLSTCLPIHLPAHPPACSPRTIPIFKPSSTDCASHCSATGQRSRQPFLKKGWRDRILSTDLSMALCYEDGLKMPPRTGGRPRPMTRHSNQGNGIVPLRHLWMLLL